MLIDIFSRRYENTPLRTSIEPRDSRLLTQAFRILKDDLHPYYQNGKEVPESVKFWTELHEALSRELGLNELSTMWLSYVTKWNGKDHVNHHKYDMVTRCEMWMFRPVSGSPDIHIKERLSLIELGFRMKEYEIARMNAAPPSSFEKSYPSARNWREDKTTAFRKAVEELNVRFSQAEYRLNYHNGFIQISNDDLIQKEVESSFWPLVSGATWKNVDSDMKEALDRRDTVGRDPAFYAARALESTIKIISDHKGFTRGSERGAHNYIDNLASRANAFISSWESDSLKGYFTHVRNPFAHGAGSGDMPELSRPQIDWAIEFAMVWIKSLIRRHVVSPLPDSSL